MRGTVAKVTLIGDAHGKMDRLQELQAQHERTIQLGDVGFGFTRVPPFKPEHQFIRGNHDDPVRAAAHPRYLGDYGYDEDLGIFYVSGAFSIDWMMRRPGISWWQEEELSPTQLAAAVELYKLVRPRYVISHDCPQSASEELLSKLSGSYFDAKKDCARSRTCAALQVMLDFYAPKRWLFGHYHVTKDFFIGPTHFQCLAELATYELDTEEST